jgi:hypothetical protein
MPGKPGIRSYLDIERRIPNISNFSIGNSNTNNGTPIFIAASDATPKEKLWANSTGGAVCSTSDADVEILAAINDVPVGGMVELSSGTFNLGNYIAPNKSYQLRGQGYSTLITQPNGANLAFLLGAYNQPNIIFENMRLDGNGANQTGGSGIIWLGTNAIYPIVRNCWILNSYLYGICNDPSVVQFAIYNNYFKDNTYHTICINKEALAETSFIISNNIIYHTDITAMGISVDYAQNGVIVGNTIVGSATSGEGINVGSCKNVAITGNIVDTTGDCGIIVYSYDTDDISDNISITGNTVMNTWIHGIAVIDWYGMIKDCVISGNVTKNNGQGGSEGSGIDVEGSGIVVVGNRSYDDQETPTQQYSYREVGSSTDFNTIVGNDFTSRYGNLLLNHNFETGDPPDSWTLSGADASYAQTNSKKIMGTYSVSLTRDGTDCAVYQNVAHAGHIGNRMRLSMYVWSSVPNSTYIQVDDGVSWKNSSMHPGDSRWHLMHSEVLTVSSSASELKSSLNITGSNTTSYADVATLVDFASSILRIGSNDIVRDNMGYVDVLDSGLTAQLAAKLPLAGGTMSGDIVMDSHNILGSVTTHNSTASLYGADGTAGHDAKVVVTGKEYATPGLFGIWTPNIGKDNDVLRMYITGCLDVAVVNWAYCTHTGIVLSDSISSGTINALNRSADNSYLNIYGGTDAYSGAI